MPNAPETPIACTLGARDLRERQAWIRRVTREHLLWHRLDGATLRLAYRPQALGELERIVAGERTCCAFLDFALQACGESIELTLRAPDGAAADARWLFAQFLPAGTPDEPAAPCPCAPDARR